MCDVQHTLQLEIRVQDGKFSTVDNSATKLQSSEVGNNIFCIPIVVVVFPAINQPSVPQGHRDIRPRVIVLQGLNGGSMDGGWSSYGVQRMLLPVAYDMLEIPGGLEIVGELSHLAFH